MGSLNDVRHHTFMEHVVFQRHLGHSRLAPVQQHQHGVFQQASSWKGHCLVMPWTQATHLCSMVLCSMYAICLMRNWIHQGFGASLGYIRVLELHCVHKRPSNHTFAELIKKELDSFTASHAIVTGDLR
eukprot:1552818-Amphidinium_carterae.1